MIPQWILDEVVSGECSDHAISWFVGALAYGLTQAGQEAASDYGWDSCVKVAVPAFITQHFIRGVPVPEHVVAWCYGATAAAVIERYHTDPLWT